MSNGFTVEYDNADEARYESWSVIAPDGNTLCCCDNEAAADNIAMMWSASTTLATMGYDAVECQKALPELLIALRTFQTLGVCCASEDCYSRKEVAQLGRRQNEDIDAILTRLRVQEVDNG